MCPMTMCGRCWPFCSTSPPLRALDLETAYQAYPGVEYHPGAVAFFAERGVALTPGQ